jgi:hypothetical protein
MEGKLTAMAIKARIKIFDFIQSLLVPKPKTEKISSAPRFSGGVKV